MGVKRRRELRRIRRIVSTRRPQAGTNTLRSPNILPTRELSPNSAISSLDVLSTQHPAAQEITGDRYVGEKDRTAARPST